MGLVPARYSWRLVKPSPSGSVLTFFRPRPRKKCRTDPDAPLSLTGYNYPLSFVDKPRPKEQGYDALKPNMKCAASSIVPGLLPSSASAPILDASIARAVKRLFHPD